MTGRFRLGEWTVSPRRHLLEAATESRRVSAKAMRVLLYLVDRPGQVVTKDELIEHGWEGRFTSDDALSTVLYELRRALGDDARRPRYLETIRKSGYRLLIEPQPVGDAGPEAATGRGSAWRWLLVSAGLAAVAGAGLWWRPSPPEAAPPIESLAVLPLEALLADDDDLLDRALTQMLITDIAQACSIEVTPGLAVRDDQTWNLETVLEVLNVDAVVEGAVARSADRLWVSLQLVDTRSGQMLWSATYDRELGDELQTLREIAGDAVLRLRDELGRRGLEGPDPPASADATP